MMTRVSVLTGVIAAMLALPVAAQAQGVPGGAAPGFHEGNRIAGPVGAVVGTAVGGVIGGVEGVLGINQRPVAFSGGYEDAPRPSYRHRKVYRAKVKHGRRSARVHRAPRGPAPGYVQ